MSYETVGGGDGGGDGGDGGDNGGDGGDDGGSGGVIILPTVTTEPPELGLMSVNSASFDALAVESGTTTNLTYDTIGNPLSYYNGTNWTFTWVEGRRLATATASGTSLSFAYDFDGIRTSKTVTTSGQTTTHKYTTESGNIVCEQIYTGSTLTATLYFIYDASGQPFALNYSTNGTSYTTYYYVLNLQGDVVGLINSSGTYVAKYVYDAWGNLLSSSGDMAETNPLRYRGYYYDSEIGFYYLQSRYYDPANRRFINADEYASTGQGFSGTNMFTYCGNNPVSRIDEKGRWFQFIIAGLIDGFLSAALTYGCGGDLWDVAESFIWGLVSGALAASCLEGTIIVGLFNMIYAYRSARDDGVDEEGAMSIAIVSLILSLGPVETDNQVAQKLSDLGLSYLQNDFENHVTEHYQEPVPSNETPANNTGPHTSGEGSAGQSAGHQWVSVWN